MPKMQATGYHKTHNRTILVYYNYEKDAAYKYTFFVADKNGKFRRLYKTDYLSEAKAKFESYIDKNLPGEWYDLEVAPGPLGTKDWFYNNEQK